jgi:hypothetical protein
MPTPFTGLPPYRGLFKHQLAFFLSLLKAMKALGLESEVEKEEGWKVPTPFTGLPP